MTWGYLIEFAFRDLTARTAIRATLVVVAAVAFAATFAFTGFGFVYGVERAEYSRLSRDPLATCLWAGDNSFKGRHIREEDAEKLKVAASSAVGQRQRVRGVYPIRLVYYTFQMKDKNNTQVTGRTIRVGADSDPLPESRPLRNGGRWFTGPDDEGIVVVPSFLVGLGFDPDNPPGEIIMIGLRTSVKVPVRGIMLQELPIRNHGYVLTERYAAKLLNPVETDPVNSAAESGPLPDEWIADLDKKGLDRLVPTIAAAIVKEFPEEQFKVAPKDVGLTTVLTVTARPRVGPPGPAPRLPKTEWDKRLKRIASIGKLAPSNAFATATVEPLRFVGVDTGDATVPTEFDLLAIYLTDILALKPAAHAAERYVLSNDQRLVVDRNVVDQVTNIGQQSARYETGMSVVAGSMSFVFAGMVWFVFRVRAEQQIAEIGMLKAMGMGRLGWLAVIQGLMVGFAGALLGTILGAALIGQAAAGMYPDDPLAAEAAAYRDPQIAAAVASAALVACMACAWEATRRARNLSPAVAIRTAG